MSYITLSDFSTTAGGSRSVAAELCSALAGNRDGGAQKAARDIATTPQVLWRRICPVDGWVQCNSKLNVWLRHLYQNVYHTLIQNVSTAMVKEL